MKTSFPSLASRKDLLIASLLLASLLVLALPTGLRTTYAASTVDTTMLYIHHDAGANLLNNGIVANTTQKWEASADTAVDSSATSSSQMTWASYYEYNTAGSINIYGTITFNIYLAANQSLTGVTLGAQINEVPVSPSNGNVTQGNLGSETSLFGGEQTTTINPTTTVAKYSVNVPVTSVTTIPADYTLHLIVYVNPGTTHAYTFTIYFDSSTDPTGIQIPLSSAPITVNSLSLSPSSIEGSGSVTATLSASDAWGLYDISASTLTATISGMTVNPINLAAMTASSSNSQTAYDGSWTYSVNPSSTNYGSYGGLWNVQSTITDQSGNTYSSSIQQLNYAVGGLCISCTSTSSTQSDSGGIMSWTMLGFPAIYVLGVAVVIFVVAVIFVARRS